LPPPEGHGPANCFGIGPALEPGTVGQPGLILARFPLTPHSHGWTVTSHWSDVEPLQRACVESCARYLVCGAGCVLAAVCRCGGSCFSQSRTRLEAWPRRCAQGRSLGRDLIYKRQCPAVITHVVTAQELQNWRRRNHSGGNLAGSDRRGWCTARWQATSGTPRRIGGGSENPRKSTRPDGRNHRRRDIPQCSPGAGYVMPMRVKTATGPSL